MYLTFRILLTKNLNSFPKEDFFSFATKQKMISPLFLKSQ